MSTLTLVDSAVSTATLTSIYALCDPRDGLIRYIGKAVDPVQRFKQHLQAGQIQRYKSRKNSWIKSLLVLGMEPEMQVLDVVSGDKANHVEREYIALYRDMNGDLLTNGTLGGDGGAVTDPDAIERIRAAHLGRKATDETRALQSASARKRCVDPTERSRLASISNGKPPIHLGENNKASRFTELQVVDIRNRCAAGESRKELASAFSTSVVQISYIVTGQTWKHVGGPVKEKNVKTKPFDFQKLEIKRRVSEGESQTAVALAFGVDASHVSRLVRGERRTINRSGESDSPLSERK